MVAFSAGGVNDVVARQWAERVKTLLGTVYVENQGGGTGTIATGEVARAPADGYTILLGSTSTMVLNPMTMPKVPYDPAKDFVPIAILAVSTTSIVVHESVPARTLKELIAYAKANPGKLSYGSAGSGTMSNLSGELFKQLTGLNDLVHIPYKGAGPGITDLVSGHIPMMTPNVTGQVLGVSPRRQDPHPGGERGAAAHGGARHSDRDRAGVPGMIGLLFLGLFAPAATPKPIVDRIAEATHAAMADAEFQKVLVASGLEAIPRFQLREGEALHRGGNRALGPGGQSRRLQGGVSTEIDGRPAAISLRYPPAAPAPIGATRPGRPCWSTPAAARR